MLSNMLLLQNQLDPTPSSSPTPPPSVPLLFLKRKQVSALCIYKLVDKILFFLHLIVSIRVVSSLLTP
ncbi:hypothetical protein L2E82_06397 [Cichorium intybus]|uniref:Uncharacterized protein n=1 Tax=Cichorium intybus TaxID=13427 RepID=A0ACB9HBF3_CICIN|nr:hypothetical protein L2E82_06397 [Cichorium intybus]